MKNISFHFITIINGMERQVQDLEIWKAPLPIRTLLELVSETMRALDHTLDLAIVDQLLLVLFFLQ